MTTSTTATAARDFSIAEFFLGLAAVAQIAVAALGICAITGLDVIPTIAHHRHRSLGRCRRFVIFLRRK